ncbi:GNAT family N-acetyltransferase [Clostridium sp. YIM B02505]|uniref:GNAT family N-acetyltransferase n=1 Tax=Clostridium yunnanense TaxID=2800325 RepID=A0ABS1ETX9_9CLOT|nr:GNAT family N-acetyltransferase [Clostridium yunnanense]MBK1812846.1 GNAT family N-acetyltransferase [Clostridium yunnanense]
MKELSTERLIIRRFSENDGEDLYEYFSNPKVLEFEPYKPFTRDEAYKEAKRREGDENFLAVCLKSGKLIGNLYFSKGDFETWEVGYVFNESYWGNGYASESLLALMKYAFLSLNVRRIIANCDPKNIPSWKLLERVGMRREGNLLQNVFFFKDEEGNPIWKDTYEYGILKTEYK